MDSEIPISFHGSGDDDMNNTEDWIPVGGDASELLICPPISNPTIPILFIFIATVGLAANVLVVYIIVILKEYQKTVTNVYVLQLAIADFMFLFILPFQATKMLQGQWNYGEAWCKITESIRMLNYYSSILFLTVMSIDRYMAINHAMNPRVLKFRSKKAVGIISAVIWFLGFLCVIYILIKAHVHHCECIIVFGDDLSYQEYEYENYTSGDYGNYTQGSDYDYDKDYEGEGPGLPQAAIDADLETFHNTPGYCTYKGKNEIILWVICNFVLAFLFPLLIICVCYAQILLKISQPMAVGTKSNKSNKTRKRVTHMVTALVTVFVVCWLPYHSFHLSRVNDSQLSYNSCTAILNFTLVFAYLSSALNPFLYTFLGTNFKKRWNSAIGRTRSFRPSFGSRSDYVQGQAKRARRKSSKMSITGHNKGPDDETLSQSNVTKHTVVPNNAIIRQEEDAV